MKFLALIGLMLLAACAPFGTSATDPNGATLTLEPTATYNVLRFAAGSADTQTVQLEIAGIGIRVNDAKCKLESQLIKCDLGNVPANKTYSLPITGNAIQARVQYARATGLNYELFLK